MSAYEDLVRLVSDVQSALLDREERIIELERELERSRVNVDSYIVDMLVDRLTLSRAHVLRALEHLDAMNYTSEEVDALTSAFARVARLALEEADPLEEAGRGR